MPTARQAGWPKRLRCMNAPSPTGNGCSVLTTRTRWHPAPTSPMPTARQAGWRKRSPSTNESLPTGQRLLGPDHPRTLRSSNYLASRLPRSGTPGRRDPPLRTRPRRPAAAARPRPPQHPALQQLPRRAYREAGRLAEAIPLYERNLADWRRLLGPDHPSTLRSGNYLASRLPRSGTPGRSDPPLRTKPRRRLPRSGTPGRRDPPLRTKPRRPAAAARPRPPRTPRSSNYLAGPYREAGRLAEPIPGHERNLARCTRVPGNDHTLTRHVRPNLPAITPCMCPRPQQWPQRSRQPILGASR